MYCGTDYMQCYTVYAKAQISITVYRTTLLTMSLPGLRKFSYLLIWCGVTKYYLVLLKCLLLRNFLCSAHAPKLEATNINCLTIMPRV